MLPLLRGLEPSPDEELELLDEEEARSMLELDPEGCKGPEEAPESPHKLPVPAVQTPFKTIDGRGRGTHFAGLLSHHSRRVDPR